MIAVAAAANRWIQRCPLIRGMVARTRAHGRANRAHGRAGRALSG
jgi:hypothetical protein